MMFSEILLVINLCVIAFFYGQYKKKVANLEEKVASLAVASLAVASLAVASLEEEKKKVASLEEEKKKVAEEKKKEEDVASSSEAEEKDVNTWYTIEDGLSRYKGEWKNGLPNGKGIKYFYKTDSYIEGNFVDSFAHGYGKQTFEQTQTWEKTVPYYEGEFNRNNYDGKGEYHFGDGDYYKGMWKNNKYHGQGATYSLRSNRTWVGEYENDVKGEGKWVKGEI